jgi:hypothetical protein
VALGWTRYLAKIVAPEGSKEVAVGQPIAITVSVKILHSFFFSQHSVRSDDLTFTFEIQTKQISDDVW